MRLPEKQKFDHSLKDERSRESASFPRAVLPLRNRPVKSESVHATGIAPEDVAGLSENELTGGGTGRFAEKFSQYVEQTNITIRTILQENETVLVSANRYLASLQRQVTALEGEVGRLTQERELIIKDSEFKIGELQELVAKLLENIQEQNEKFASPHVLMDVLAMKVSDELSSALADARLLLGDA